MTTIEPRTSVVTIYQGDYLDRIRHLEQKYEAAVKSEKIAPPRLLDEKLLSAELAEKHEALVTEAERSALQVTLKALGRRKWRELVTAHPAREGNETDANVGVNEDEFKDVLVPESITTPVLTPDDLDAMSDVDYDRLYFTAFALNRLPSSSPKALASPASQVSDET